MALLCLFIVRFFIVRFFIAQATFLSLPKSLPETYALCFFIVVKGTKCTAFRANHYATLVCHHVAVSYATATLGIIVGHTLLRFKLMQLTD